MMAVGKVKQESYIAVRKQLVTPSLFPRTWKSIIKLRKLSSWVVSTVNYLQLIECNDDAAKQSEELKVKPPTQEEEANIGLSKYH